MSVSRIVTTVGGPELSQFVAGMWRLDGWKMSTDDLVRFVETCIDLGVTTFDHADIYGLYACEEIFGRALERRPELRNRIEIVTKCGVTLVSARRPANTIHGYDTSGPHIVASVESSLRALHTDRLDVLLLHRADPLMNADEVAEAFETLRSSGKVLHFGVSNFGPAQFDLLESRLSAPLVTNQIEIGVLHPEPALDGTLDDLQRRRVAPMAWSPFGGGRLFDDRERSVRVRQALLAIGEAVGMSVDQMALAWILALPSRVLPVLGTGDVDRVRSAVRSAAMALTRDQWFSILEASLGHEVP